MSLVLNVLCVATGFLIYQETKIEHYVFLNYYDSKAIRAIMQYLLIQLAADMQYLLIQLPADMQYLLIQLAANMKYLLLQLAAKMQYLLI